MTAAAFMVVAATLGLIALAAAAILTLVEPGGMPRPRSMVDVAVGGLFFAFVAVVVVLYLGASL